MFVLRSSAFASGGKIPEKYAEQGAVSPPLSWEGVPKGARSLALVVTDPDVPEMFNFPRNFFHWILFDIPPSATSLEEGASPKGRLPTGAKELNSDFVTFGIPGFGKGYGPPWPPDAEHRYVFTLYALKCADLGIPDSADHAEFSKALLPQTIMTATCVGLYGPAKSKLPGS